MNLRKRRISRYGLHDVYRLSMPIYWYDNMIFSWFDASLSQIGIIAGDENQTYQFQPRVLFAKPMPVQHSTQIFWDWELLLCFDFQMQITGKKNLTILLLNNTWYHIHSSLIRFLKLLWRNPQNCILRLYCWWTARSLWARSRANVFKMNFFWTFLKNINSKFQKIWLKNTQSKFK